MDKNLKKVAKYSIADYTPVCLIKTAREHLKDCKPHIIDDAVDAFESTTYRQMIAVEYINVESGTEFNTVSCSGYVWTGVRTAERWWFCYCVNAYSGDASITVLDGNDDQYEYHL